MTYSPPPDFKEDATLAFTTANGISIHYKLEGQSGPVVVLLHEMGGSLDSWDKVVPGLSANFRVLRYDQRGAGLTEKVREPFTNDTAVADLEALLSELKLAPPYHLVAVAAAGTQALAFRERQPDRVRSLVLCNPALGVDPSRAGALIERAEKAEREGMRAVLALTLDKSYPSELTDRETYEEYRGRYLGQDPVGFAHANRLLAGTNVNGLLPNITCPAMVVAGRQDGVRPPAASEEIAGKIPGARFELIDAGHFMPTTGPGALLALLKDFLGKASRS
ncbi:MAG TPA: alpha/beta fold hydrolase [Xanthobacteraceae bacterium]|nr:alpha/beta fold hydrolase [Xanthobacteraceae bacterium]